MCKLYLLENSFQLTWVSPFGGLDLKKTNIKNHADPFDDHGKQAGEKVKFSRKWWGEKQRERVKQTSYFSEYLN